MKTNDLNSFSLMPPFAASYAFACKVLDDWMTQNWMRAKVLSAPWSLDALNALTDEELINLYKIYSVLPYYPELEKENRIQLLYLQNALRQRTTTADAIKQIIKYLANGTYARVLINIEDLYQYSISLYSEYINFTNEYYNAIINCCRELLRPSQELLTIDSHTNDLEVDSDIWALAIVGIETLNRVTVIKAIRAGMTSAWSLTQGKHLVDQAYDVECPAVATPSLIGTTANFYHSKDEFINMIQAMYAGETSVVDGTFGISRLNKPEEIFIVYADGRIEPYE